MADLNATPSGNRLHIGFFGKTNSGKSSFINAFAGHDVSIVADVPGTTTDPVYRAMEILPLGPCELIDTAGFCDESELGEEREKKTRLAADKSDLAVILIAADTIPEKFINIADADYDAFQTAFPSEDKWFAAFKDKKIPVLFVISKADICGQKKADRFAKVIRDATDAETIAISNKQGGFTDIVKEKLAAMAGERTEKTILGGLVNNGDLVMLVMPQDIQAPKGRLILPQVQTIRELLDRKCRVICTTTDKYIESLDSLKNPPDLIITDSQGFAVVYEGKPEKSRLTSFSILFAGYKGDISYYVEGAKKIPELKEDSKVLIAECCTHAPLEEDIGRVKLPRMFRKIAGEGLQVDIVSGSDFPENLKEYDLIVQCGACMFNRQHVMSRINKAKEAGVPMTNYGTSIAQITGILDKVTLPK